MGRLCQGCGTLTGSRQALCSPPRPIRRHVASLLRSRPLRCSYALGSLGCQQRCGASAVRHLWRRRAS
eukprot:3773649-Lingulodinium_polyedra.AAC.1